ncbi:DUF3618 domain-containing protein [Streptomyces sp. NPDC050560]|uniref:DUF3618 domain-containing protein n=1 Tax=Streptomyces sp. NPDC050560 TaxID=3365630 RepID=UPI0037AC4E0B
MTDGAHQYSTPSSDPEELRAQVAHTRRELGHTVEELAAKADVKARARQRADETRNRLRQRAERARGRARGRADHAKGRARGRGACAARAVRDHRMAVLGAAAASAVVAAGVARGCGRRQR